MTASSSSSLSTEYISDFLDKQTKKTKILKKNLARRMVCYLFFSDAYTAIKWFSAVPVIVICYLGLWHGDLLQDVIVVVVVAAAFYQRGIAQK